MSAVWTLGRASSRPASSSPAPPHAASSATRKMPDCLIASIAKSTSLTDVHEQGLERLPRAVAVLAKMLDAGHPSEPEFELVRYSQGSVRHRYYPPDFEKNSEMTLPQRLRCQKIGGTITRRWRSESSHCTRKRDEKDGGECMLEHGWPRQHEGFFGS